MSAEIIFLFQRMYEVYLTNVDIGTFTYPVG